MTRRKRCGRTVYGIRMLSSTPLHRMLSVLVLLLPSSAVAQAVICRDGSVGYDNVDALNGDIDAEVARIEAGERPEAAYIYRICPGTTIIMDGKSLKPKLEGSVFQCGNGTFHDMCRLQGGLDQIVVEKSKLPDYSISDVRFSAITFTGFSNSLLSGSADSTCTITIDGCSIQDAESRFVINQSNGDKGGPFNVNLFGTTLRNVTTGVVLSSNGGNTIIQGSSFLDLTAMAIGSVGNSGIMLVNEATVIGGRYEDGFVAMHGSSVILDKLLVSELQNIQGSVLLSTGYGSTLEVSNSVFTKNSMVNTASTWNAIRGYAKGSIAVSNSQFSENYQLRSIVAIDEGSEAVVEQVTVNLATGSALVDSLVSSVIYVDGKSNATISRVSLDAISHFTTSIFTNNGSHVVISKSCLNSGNTAGAVYASKDSSYVLSQNYINDQAYRSTASAVACPGPGNRLIKEHTGSQCFEGSLCNTKCERFGDTSVCLALSAEAPSTRGMDPSLPPASTYLFQTTDSPSVPSPSIGTGSPTLPGTGSLSASPSSAGGTLIPGSESPSQLSGGQTPAPTPTSGTFGPTSSKATTSSPTTTGGNSTGSPTGVGATGAPTPTSGTFAPSPSQSASKTPGPTPTSGTFAPTSTGVTTLGPTPTSGTFAPSPSRATTPGPTPTSGTFSPSRGASVRPSPGSGTFSPTATPGPTSTFSPTGPTVPPISLLPTTDQPTHAPTISAAPSVSSEPSSQPSVSTMPSSSPSEFPSSQPSVSMAPSSFSPSASPSSDPSSSPSDTPSTRPSVQPSDLPSAVPTSSQKPSEHPSDSPSSNPSNLPTAPPTLSATTLAPTFRTTTLPTSNCNPQCDCKKYWYGPGYNPGYGSGYGYGTTYGYSKSKKGSKGQWRRELQYAPPAGYIHYNYDPCFYYCQWVLHNAYAYNRARHYGNGYYKR